MKFLALIVLLLISPTWADDSPLLQWNEWDGAFEKAKSEKKLVLLDLEAVWCHWCHVMDKTTYRDPKVLKILSEHVIAVKVDQDSRPDLAHRYQDYGWPATIIFDQNGLELEKLSGYVNPEEMATILQRLKDEPEPLKEGPQFEPQAGPGQLSPELVKKLEARHFDHYDEELGAWGKIHKYLNPPVLEYCLARALEGDERNKKMAKQTLDANLALIDPVWGGVYQYSDSGIWTSPHFEKIMSTQAGNLRVYSLAYAQFKDPEYLAASKAVADYLLEFLRGEDGAFYVSQDADLVPGSKAGEYFALNDLARRELGIPRVDTNQYSRENGQAIEALALYSAVSGDERALEAALKSANWLLQQRNLGEGGFSHGGNSQAGVFLGDTLYSARAFLMLYRVTADPMWLKRAETAAQFMQQNFAKTGADGYFTSDEKVTRYRPENIDLSRFANLLFAHTGKPEHRQMAERALAYFAIDEITDQFNPGGILLAQQELKEDPTHITVVGTKDDKLTQSLFKTAAASPQNYLRLDLWQPGTELPPHSEVEYPNIGEPAAYLCSRGRCSAPMSDPREILEHWLPKKI